MNVCRGEFAKPGGSSDDMDGRCLAVYVRGRLVASLHTLWIERIALHFSATVQRRNEVAAAVEVASVSTDCASRMHRAM
jgi:hypothetical protein